MTYALQQQTGVGAQLSSQSQVWDQHLTELLERIGQGNQAAFTAFYHATQTLVYGLALRIVRNAAAAEDVTIDVYLQLHQCAARYNSARGKPAAWLLTLTRSRAIDRPPIACGATRPTANTSLSQTRFPSSHPSRIPKRRVC